MSELSPTELVTYLAHIAEDGVSDGVAGRNIVRHFESQRQRIAELEAEVARLKEEMEHKFKYHELFKQWQYWRDPDELVAAYEQYQYATSRNKDLEAEVEFLKIELARLKGRLLEFTGDEDGHIL